MKLLKWLYPGMGIKRWIALTIFGIVMLSMGFVMIISEEGGQASFGTSLIVIFGILAVITGTKRIINSLISILLPPERDKELVDIVYKKRQLEKGPRVVVIGGGRGFVTLLRGLKEFTSNIAAIVAVIDEGRFSDGFGNGSVVSSASDVRESLIALADAEPVVERLFRYRFKKGTELWGYNFGNLFIDAMSDVVGNFDGAVKESSKVLAIRGNVILSTLSKISLIAQRNDGTETIGKQRVLNRASPIRRVYLRPKAAVVTQEAVSAIEKADAIVFGPGNLYTSTIPNLLIEGLKGAILASKAARIYILNLMTKLGETDKYNASDHIKTLGEHISPELINYCIANTTELPDQLLKKYAAEDSYPVYRDKENIKKFNCKIFEADLLDADGGHIRHDPVKTSRSIFSVINDYKKSKLYGR